MTRTDYHFWRRTREGWGWSNPYSLRETAEALARMQGTCRVCERTIEFETLPTEALIAGVEPRIIGEHFMEYTVGRQAA